MKIIPTVFATSKKEFDFKLNLLAKISRDLQIDLMDGKFVKNKSIKVSDIPNLKKYKNNFEAHLMVFNPERYFNALKEKGFKKIIFHYESVEKSHITDLIKKIKLLKMLPCLAINPETKTPDIALFLSKINHLLIMGVHPGKEHQSIILRTYKKIEEIRKLNKKITIQIDGGVNEKTASKLKKSGAVILNSGSFISDSASPKKSLEKLRKI
ncbi:MAG: hypothetical protein AABY10_05480 [Nanoarchaeota archaeon]